MQTTRWPEAYLFLISVLGHGPGLLHGGFGGGLELLLDLLRLLLHIARWIDGRHGDARRRDFDVVDRRKLLFGEQPDHGYDKQQTQNAKDATHAQAAARSLSIHIASTRSLSLPAA